MMLQHQRKRIKPLTYEMLDTVLRVHVIPEIGDHPLDEIGTRTLGELAGHWLEGGATQRTVNMRLGVVARLLSLAVDMELILGAPRPRYLRVPRRFPRFLSDDEASRLLDAADDLWRSMMLIGLRTGLRIGELRGLQWGDVDFARGVVIVRRTDPGRRDMPATTPKGGADRIVALSPEALAVLHHLQALAGNMEPTIPVWPSTGRQGSGRTRTLRAGWGAMRRAADRAGLKGVSWHTLRHTCASWLVMRGVSLRIVQAILGHASIRQTERYAHLSPGFAFHGAVALLDVPLAPWVPQIKALPATAP
jgi:integrase